MCPIVSATYSEFPVSGVAQNDRLVEGDLILKDMGTGLPFRPAVFDGAIRSVFQIGEWCA